MQITPQVINIYQVLLELCTKRFVPSYPVKTLVNNPTSFLKMMTINSVTYFMIFAQFCIKQSMGLSVQKRVKCKVFTMIVENE